MSAEEALCRSTLVTELLRERHRIASMHETAARIALTRIIEQNLPCAALILDTEELCPHCRQVHPVGDICHSAGPTE